MLWPRGGDIISLLGCFSSVWAFEPGPVVKMLGINAIWPTKPHLPGVCLLLGWGSDNNVTSVQPGHKVAVMFINESTPEGVGGVLEGSAALGREAWRCVCGVTDGNVAGSGTDPEFRPASASRAGLSQALGQAAVCLLPPQGRQSGGQENQETTKDKTRSDRRRQLVQILITSVRRLSPS